MQNTLVAPILLNQGQVINGLARNLSSNLTRKMGNAENKIAEAGGLIIGDPIDLDRVLGSTRKQALSNQPAVDRLIAANKLSGLEGDPELLRAYQSHLSRYTRETVPLEHSRAWEILVAGRTGKDPVIAASVLRWGMKRFTRVRQA